MLGTIYIPAMQSRFYNDENEIAVLSEIMSQYSNHKYVFINGDINGRRSRLVVFTRLGDFVSDMFEFDDITASFFDKTLLKSQYFLGKV